MSKPPMPDPLHLGELASKVAAMEAENRALKSEIRRLLKAEYVGPTTTERLVTTYDLDRAQPQWMNP